MFQRTAAALAVALTGTALAACGSSSSSTSTTGTAGSSASAATGAASSLKFSVTEAGKSSAITGPSSASGGLVQLSLQNQGKMPHSVQLVLVLGNHTTDEAFRLVSSNSDKTPTWLRAIGGVSTTAPGQTNTAVVNLLPGKYLVTELGGPSSQGVPAKTELTVSTGSHAGALPATPATVTAATAGSNRYRWDISALHAGQNRLTFKSEGHDALHVITAIRIKPGQNPSLADIEKSFKSNGPPSFADLTSYQSTAVLDGGRSQVTSLDLQPGTYVLFCPLTDRDGGKPHFAEGLLTKYTVK